jgi:Asp-tRNA(Asn)/Glu-tRNA(Gln) amidotransferase A subunit family amidase
VRRRPTLDPLLFAALVVLLPGRTDAQRSVPPRPDLVFETSVTDLQTGLAAGRFTSVQLVDAYLARIAAYDTKGPALNAMIRVNPKARADAAALDAERRAGRVRGPLHGIPIILKDNYNTADMPTSGGSIALAGLMARNEGMQVRKLRDAGAIVIGKSNLHELASGITTIGSLGGQTCNPYDPDRYPGGSSGGSGAAVAASFAAVAWGSDTCGSIRIPASSQNLFGLRPTKGISSVDGIMPLSHTQDVGGPLARTVMDLAIALDATVGPDPTDPATRLLDGRTPPRFVAALDAAALRGARLGVLTTYFGNDADDQEAARVVRASIDRLKARGAEVVEVAIPGLDSAVGRASVIDFELKPDLLDYLAKVPGAPVASLGEILDRGLYHVALETGLRRREARGAREGDGYRAALAARDEARRIVNAYLDEHKLDALVYPTMKRKPARIGDPQPGSNCALSAVTGLPAISMPAGFTSDSLPLAVELLGRQLADARLVAYAYDYEQATHPRRPPSTTPPLVNGRAPEPVAFTARAAGKGATALGRFRFDATKRALEYSVRVTGMAAGDLIAVTLDRSTAEKKGPTLFRLSGPGVAEAAGTLQLGPTDRGDLLAGRLYLSLYTTAEALGTARAALVCESSPRERASVPRAC